MKSISPSQKNSWILIAICASALSLGESCARRAQHPAKPKADAAPSTQSKDSQTDEDEQKKTSDTGAATSEDPSKKSKKVEEKSPGAGGSAKPAPGTGTGSGSGASAALPMVPGVTYTDTTIQVTEAVAEQQYLAARGLTEKLQKEGFIYLHSKESKSGEAAEVSLNREESLKQAKIGFTKGTQSDPKKFRDEAKQHWLAVKMFSAQLAYVYFPDKKERSIEVVKENCTENCVNTVMTQEMLNNFEIMKAIIRLHREIDAFYLDLEKEITQEAPAKEKQEKEEHQKDEQEVAANAEAAKANAKTAKAKADAESAKAKADAEVANAKADAEAEPSSEEPQPAKQ